MRTERAPERGLGGGEDGAILDSLQPRYRRVQQALADEIAKGGRSIGSHLPPERALAEHFAVSRVTLRHALAELERSGVVARDVRGWAVVGSRIGEPPDELMSFTEMARSRGLTASAHVLEQRVRQASIDEAESLGLAPGASLFELERLRLMDGVPIMLDKSCVPLALAPELPDLDFQTASLYVELQARYAIRPTRARLAVEAVSADGRQAALLELEPGRPLLRCQQLTEDQNGRPIETCEMLYRGDRYRFRATLARTGALEPVPAQAPT